MSYISILIVIIGQYQMKIILLKNARKNHGENFIMKNLNLLISNISTDRAFFSKIVKYNHEYLADI